MKILLAVSLLLITALPTPAQTVAGSILGTVADATGASVPGFTITLVNLGTNERRVATTSETGSYQFVICFRASTA